MGEDKGFPLRASAEETLRIIGFPHPANPCLAAPECGYHCFMNITTKTIISAIATTLIIATAGAAGSTATAAEIVPSSQTTSASKIVAWDQTDQIKAKQTGVGSITITAPAKTKVVARAKKFRETRTATTSGAATFNNLTPGVTYTFTAAGQTTQLRAIEATTPATHLTVFTTDTAGAVTLTWDHKNTITQGDVNYEINATPAQEPQIDANLRAKFTLTEQSKDQEFTLTGLNTDVLYTFTVTAINTLGAGKASSASMTKSLHELTGLALTVPDPPVTPVTPTPKPAAVPTVPAAQPAQPATRTIYVCPSGFSDVGTLCEKTLGYTFHNETETRSYSYHTEMENYGPWKDFGTDWSGTTCPNGGTLHPGLGCMGYDQRPISVKDATPADFSDNGGTWSKTTTVKDSTPAGFSDNSSAWVQTAAKQAQVVSA